MLGVSSQDLANFLQSSLSGVPVTYYRERDQLIEISLRGPPNERAQSVAAGKSRRADGIGQDGAAARRSPTSTTVSRTASSGAATACRPSPCAATSTAHFTPATVTAQIAPTLDDIRASAAGRLSPRCRRRGRGKRERPELGQRGHAAVHPRRVHGADDPAAQLPARAAGGAHRAARTDRRDRVPAAVQRAVRFRRDARHDRADGHDHAQLGDPGRPDRAGHRGRPRRL